MVGAKGISFFTGIYVVYQNCGTRGLRYDVGKQTDSLTVRGCERWPQGGIKRVLRYEAVGQIGLKGITIGLTLHQLGPKRHFLSFSELIKVTRGGVISLVNPPMNTHLVLPVIYKI